MSNDHGSDAVMRRVHHYESRKLCLPKLADLCGSESSSRPHQANRKADAGTHRGLRPLPNLCLRRQPTTPPHTCCPSPFLTAASIPFLIHLPFNPRRLPPRRPPFETGSPFIHSIDSFTFPVTSCWKQATSIVFPTTLCSGEGPSV